MPTFLVVDDSATVRMSLVKALQNADRSAKVLQAATGREAMAPFLAHDVHTVFLDMVLETPTAARDLGHAMLAARPETRIVLVTGLDREDQGVVELISAGAFAYLRKPVREHEIRGVLADIEAEDGNVGRIR